MYRDQVVGSTPHAMTLTFTNDTGSQGYIRLDDPFPQFTIAVTDKSGNIVLDTIQFLLEIDSPEIGLWCFDDNMEPAPAIFAVTK